MASAARAVLFDWDDTLCGATPHRYETIKRVLTQFGIAHEYAELHRAWVVADDPVLDRVASGFWARLQRELRLDDRADVVEALIAEFERRDTYRRFEIFADASSLLDELAGRGWHLGVVSNNVEAEERIQEVGLAERFMTVVTPRDNGGVGKPDPSIFRIALDRLGAAPERTIYIGDTYEVDVLGAEAAGLRAFLIDRMGIYAADGYPAWASLVELVRELE